MGLYSRIVISTIIEALVFTTLLIVIGDSASAGQSYVNGFPADDGFFPIGVWQQSPHNAEKYKSIGINTYVGLWEGPTEAQLAELARHGIFVVAAQNDIALNSPNRNVVKAWLQQDEPDNAQPMGPWMHGPCIPAAEVARRSREIKVRDPTRPVAINFGRGIADEAWPGRGTCTGDLGYYDIAAAGADILSFDIYPVANSEGRPNVSGKLEYVARGVSNLLKRATVGQSVWAALETTAIQSQQRVTPAQLRAEAWMALIHGAKGICYFVTEWTSGFREDAIFRYPEIVAEVGNINRVVRMLAPVLNSPDVGAAITASSPVPVDTMVKFRDGRLYLFAILMKNDPSIVSINLHGAAGPAVTVLGEDRVVKLVDGSFKDGFSGYGVHLYEIPLAHEGP
jgi:hypothetical protein